MFKFYKFWQIWGGTSNLLCFGTSFVLGICYNYRKAKYSMETYIWRTDCWSTSVKNAYKIRKVWVCYSFVRSKSPTKNSIKIYLFSSISALNVWLKSISTKNDSYTLKFIYYISVISFKLELNWKKKLLILSYTLHAKFSYEKYCLWKFF